MKFVATVLIVLFGFVMFSHAKENQCSEDQASCPDDFTCCNGSYGCCPIKNAVCCGDSVHCCPDGYTCDMIKGICKMGRKSVPLLKKIPAKPNKVYSSCFFFSLPCSPRLCLYEPPDPVLVNLEWFS